MDAEDAVMLGNEGLGVAISVLNSNHTADISSTEELLLGDRLVEVPADLYEDEEIFSNFFSIDTWNDLLPEDLKLRLLKYLPTFPEDDIEEKARTIEMLFGGENLHFGNPLTRFRADLLNGEYTPENAEMRDMVVTAQKRNFDEWIENYQFEIAQKCLDSRKKHLETATGNIVTVPKIERKRGCRGGNMAEKIAKRYMEEIARIKHEMGEEGFSSDDEEYFHPKVAEYAAAADPPAPGPVCNGTSDHQPEEEVAEVAAPLALTQDMQPCFFSLLRDLLLQSEARRLPRAGLEAGVRQWQESPIAPLNPWYGLAADWAEHVASALSFLSGACPSQEPGNFTPMVAHNPTTGEHKTSCLQVVTPLCAGEWHWTGQEAECEQELQEACEWWLERVDSCPPVPSVPDTEAAEPAPGNQTSWVVRPSSTQERQSYHLQEARRYADPGAAWRWQVK